MSTGEVSCYQVGEVRDPRKALVDDELERDGCQEEDESQLEPKLRVVGAHGERRKRQTADEELDHTERHRQTTHRVVE